MVATGHTRFVPVKHFSFQSAFHRGNGCYGSPQIKRVVLDDFQSAFHRGNGCYRVINSGIISSMYFQSAFHRGNGCYLSSMVYCPNSNPFFQSAFHRGNGCYCGCASRSAKSRFLSVRFSSRQWLLLNHSMPNGVQHVSFSPLFIAAMVATVVLGRM